MMRNKKPEFCVYRIEVGDQEYIGVTKDFDARMEAHIDCAYRKNSPQKVYRAMRDSLAGFTAKVLFRGSESECYAVEKTLRPRANMGLNTAKGGSAEDLAMDSSAKFAVREEAKNLTEIPVGKEVFTIESVRQVEPGELCGHFKKPNTVIVVQGKTEYLQFIEAYGEWQDLEGRRVVAHLARKKNGEFVESVCENRKWHWLMLDFVIG